MPSTISLTQQGVPGVCRAGGAADPLASVIVTLFSAPCGGRVVSVVRTLVPNARTIRGAARSGHAAERPPVPGGCLLRGFLTVATRWPTGVDRRYSMCPVPYAS